MYASLMNLLFVESDLQGDERIFYKYLHIQLSAIRKEEREREKYDYFYGFRKKKRKIQGISCERKKLLAFIENVH